MLPLRATLVLIAVTLCATPLLVSAPLLDPDEGLHAAIAQEMVLGGDYVTPRFLGEPFLDKPILFFWAEALSIRALGATEAAVRLPPLLFGALGMLSVALLASAMFDRDVGLAAGIVYGTMLLPVAISEMAVHDIALVPFTCGAAWALWRAARSARSWAWGVPAGLCLGLSILTKGLAGVAFAGLFAVCLGARERPAIARLAVALSIGVIVAVLVAAPWYVAMERAHPGYLHYYFIERHLQGYLTSTQRHAGRPWWYYLPIVAGGALPWTGFVVDAVRRAPAAARRHAHVLTVWAWCVLGIAFVSVGESKLVTYVLPAFPALAIGTAIGLAGARPSRAAWMVQTGALAVLPSACVAAAHELLGAPIGPSWIGPAAAAGVVLWLAARAWPAASSFEAISTGAVMALVSVVTVIVVPLPRAAAYLTSRDLAGALNATGRLPPRVSVLDERIGSLIFYLSPALRADAAPERFETASLAGAIERARVDPPDAILAVRDDQRQRFARLFQHAPEPFARAGTFTLYRADALREALERGAR